jgi:hypothetical protein
MLRDVEFTECSQPRCDILIGQLQYANGVAVLNGGVVCVEVLQECQECVQPNLRDSNLLEQHDIIIVRMPIITYTTLLLAEG